MIFYMSQYIKPSEKQIIRKIRKHGGDLTALSRVFNRSRKSVENWISSSPVLREALEEAQLAMVDEASKGLRAHIRNGDLDAIKFVLTKFRPAARLGWGDQDINVKVDVTSKVISDESKREALMEILSQMEEEANKRQITSEVTMPIQENKETVEVAEIVDSKEASHDSLT